MTQWKLMPVEPTEEMLDAYEAARLNRRRATCDWDSRADRAEEYRAWMDVAPAAPSPAGGEEVERVARAMYNARIAGKKSYSEFDDLVTNGYPDIYHQELGNARAAISAMRPAPKLTEEDRARVEEVRVRHEKDGDREVQYPDDGLLYADKTFLLSLIDKLAGDE